MSKALTAHDNPFLRLRVAPSTFDGAGNQQLVAAPGQTTTSVWDQENRLRQILLLDGSRNTMSYRADGLRAHLVDEEGDKSPGVGQPGQQRLPGPAPGAATLNENGGPETKWETPGTRERLTVNSRGGR